MTIWKQLGIEETRDITVIRSAYAARAKELHPEECPDEFKQLQAAYKTAVRYAKGIRAVENMNFSGFQSEKHDSRAVRLEMEKKSADNNIAEMEQVFEYDYGEVEEETLSEQFFQEFSYIVWNPWLLNNQVCWELFLHRPQYKELFEDADFRKNLVMTMCMLSGWHRSTIRYFDSFLASFQKEGEAGTNIFRWTWKKNRLWNKGFITTEKWITKEQKELQEILFSSVKRKTGFSPGRKKETEVFFNDRKAVESYLQIYLSYAAKHSRQLEKMYHENCSGKSFARVIFFCLVIWILFIGGLNLKGIFPGAQIGQKEQQKKWEEQRRDNMRQYIQNNKGV